MATKRASKAPRAKAVACPDCGKKLGYGAPCKASDCPMKGKRLPGKK